MNAWSTPKHKDNFKLTDQQRTKLIQIGLQLTSSLQIGYKQKITEQIVAKTNAYLFRNQIIKVEFIKIDNQNIKKYSEELAKKTLSDLIGIHGNKVILFRKHPNKNIKDIF
jgi:RNA-binding protein YhbY